MEENIQKINKSRVWSCFAYKNFLVVVGLSVVFFGALSGTAHAASLYFFPNFASYTVGDTFRVDVLVSSPDQAMNATSGVILFPKDKLQILSLSKGGSIMSLWVQEPLFSNTAGTVNFEGIALNPGFSGSAGKIIAINFKVRAAGSASLNFSSGAVLANDGAGTNILISLGSAKYSLNSPISLPPDTPSPPVTPPSVNNAPAAPTVVSDTHESEDVWYANNSPNLSWQVPSGATAISYAIDKRPSTNPNFVITNIVSEEIFLDLEDGAWYFHINFRNAFGWGALTHRRILIDTTSPRSFDITINDRGDPTNPQPILNFSTTDATSGVDFYKIRIGGGDIFPVSIEEIKFNPYVMPLQAPGLREVTIWAFDKAGNSTASTTEVIIQTIEPPSVTYFTDELFLGERLTVRGVGIPGAQVELYIHEHIHKRGEKDIETVATLAGVVDVDEAGEWELSSDSFYIPRDYSFHVRQIDQRGAISAEAEVYQFAVKSFVKIAYWEIPGFVIIFALIALFVISMAAVVFLTAKLRAIRKHTKKEAKDASRKLHTTVDVLKDEISEELQKLEHIKNKGKFSKKEREIEKKLKENLDTLEKYIKKEIKDIEGD